MATAYKTPGVYVEEIPKFPPSIAPVETALPAFIGYTEKAIRNGGFLYNKAVPIESIAEYEELFGGAPPQDVQVFLDSNNNFIKASATSMLFLYDSLRMFYANGGGKCYIVSVGSYPDSAAGIKETEIEAGLKAVAMEDEPTILLMPDAVSIAGGPYNLQQKALAQCARLMDRVAVFDLLSATTNTDFDTQVSNFRNAIGINALKYGIAYSPWINAHLPRQVLRRNLTLTRDGTGDDIPLTSLTTDPGIASLLGDVILAEGAADALKTTASANVSVDALQSALDTYRQKTDASSAAELATALQNFTKLIFAALQAVQDVRQPATPYPPGTKFEAVTLIDSYLASNPGVKNAVLELVIHHRQLGAAGPNAISNVIVAGPALDDTAKLLGFADGAALLAFADAALEAAVTAKYAPADTLKKRADVGRAAAYTAANNALALFSTLRAGVIENEKSLNDTLLAGFGKFKELVTRGAEALNLLPPSGAIAGVFATVDRERGVWKAPANVSLNSIIGPAVKITDAQQESYNVDVNAGKSINIIRPFIGKGTLVWGARTLAGNDNEWRYVNVRRFLNFVEESVKKATALFVFEPNDANTWVKIQAMIENFLTTLWRQGALQGIKPEHAFYVAVGLGKTMTPLDILEGRMIIEIGMAAVRPAEFIILRFSHKMPES
jgi:uncharacterized protein